MANIFIKILLLEAFLFFINTRGFSQSAHQKVQSKTRNEIKTPGVSKFLKAHPQVDPESKVLIKENKEQLLNFFVNEAHQINHLSFITNSGKTIENIHIDSLLPKFKEYIELYVSRNRNSIVEDSLYRKSERLNSIYEKIKAESRKVLKAEEKTSIKEIINSISVLPISKEKIGLELKCDQLNIHLKTYFNEVIAICDSAKSQAETITDDFEKGQAYTYIGDFARLYQIDDLAIEMYYKGVEYFENSPRTDNEKYFAQGIAVSNLAKLFLGIDLDKARLIACSYYLKSLDLLERANNITQSNITQLNYDATRADLWNNVSEYDLGIDSLSKNEADLIFLLNIKGIYNQILARGHLDNETKYLEYYTIAGTMIHENKNKEALFYSLCAFPWAAYSHKNNDMAECLRNISYLYASLGNKSMSNKYHDLLVYLANILNDPVQHYFNLYDKANNYFQLKEYDSALIYVNSLQFDPALYSALYQPSYDKILTLVTELKVKIFGNLKNSLDSVVYYKQESTDFQTDSWKYFTYLLENESFAKSHLIESSKNKEIETKNNFIKELNTKINLNKSQISNLKDTLISINSSLKAKREENAIIELTAKTIRGQLYDSTNKLRVQVALNAVLKINNQQLQSKNETLIKARSWLLAIIGISIFILALLSVVVRNRIHRIKILDAEIKKKENEAAEKDLGKKLAEQKLLNDTALGHDLIELVGHVPLLIKSLGKEKDGLTLDYLPYSICRRFAEKVFDYFKSNFELKEEQLNTVGEDLYLAREYCELLSMMDEEDFKADINFEDIDRELTLIKIPKHNLVNFIANAYKHPRVNANLAAVRITVKGLKTKDGYEIVIVDDGGGFESLNLETKKDTRGLKLVLRQVVNYNSIRENPYTILFTKDNIENLYVDGLKTGTRITYKLVRK